MHTRKEQMEAFGRFLIYWRTSWKVSEGPQADQWKSETKHHRRDLRTLWCLDEGWQEGHLQGTGRCVASCGFNSFGDRVTERRVRAVVKWTGQGSPFNGNWIYFWRNLGFNLEISPYYCHSCNNHTMHWFTMDRCGRCLKNSCHICHQLSRPDFSWLVKLNNPDIGCIQL